MLKQYRTTKNKMTLLKAVFDDTQVPEFVSKNKDAFTEDFKNNIIYFYCKKIENYTQLTKKIDKALSWADKDILVDLKSFETENVCIKQVLRAWYLRTSLAKDEIYTEKTDKKSPQTAVEFYLQDDSLKDFAKEMILLAENTRITRSLQITPPNVCTSEWLADYIKNDLSKVKGLKVTVLERKEIEKLKMGLVLSVNAGSNYEPRVVIIDYSPLKDSKERIAIVGKGITYDAGGYSIKTSPYMYGMKMDMTGSAIAAYTVKNIAENNIKTNVSAVMMITDNRLNKDASVPDNVYTSMSKKTVEIVDTDAEGRLVLADGITYAKDVLKAKTIIDVATLTGTILTALGDKYTGIYTNSDSAWDTFNKAASKAKEKVWRMPIHEDFNKPNKESLIADYLNCSNDGSLSDCNIAAAFLHNFATDKVDFIHCDVAGTAEDSNHKPLGCLIGTLTEFAKLKGDK